MLLYGTPIVREPAIVFRTTYQEVSSEDEGPPPLIASDSDNDVPRIPYIPSPSDVSSDSDAGDREEGFRYRFGSFYDHEIIIHRRD